MWEEARSKFASLDGVMVIPVGGLTVETDNASSADTISATIAYFASVRDVSEHSRVELEILTGGQA